MKTRPCPTCGSSFSSEDVNLKEGVAVCRGCDALVRLSVIATDPEADASEVDISRVPAGCWVEDRGGEAVVGTDMRSPVGYFLLIWAVFWNGITSIFVVSTIRDWFRFLGSAPGSKGAGDLASLLGSTLFLLPFVLAGVGSIIFCLFIWFGKCEVTVGRDEVRMRWGFGALGRTKRIELSRATPTTIERASWQQNDQNVYLIQIGTDPKIRFGSGLKEERKKWMCAAVGAAIAARLPGRPRTVPPLLSESRA